MGVKKKRRVQKGRHVPFSPENVNSLPSIFQLADVVGLLGKGQFDQARAVLVQSANNPQSDPRELSFGWIRYYLALNQQKEAEERLRKLLEWLPADREALLLLVEMNLKKGDIATAAYTISLALEQYPANVEVLRYASKVHAKAGYDNDSLLCLQSALRHDPDNVAILIDLSTWCIEHNQWRQARDYLIRLRHLTPNNPSVLLGLGTSYLQIGDYDAALEMLQQSLQLDSANVQTMINLGVVYRLTKQHDKASAVLHEALRRDVHNVAALSALSSLHIDSRNFSEGLECALQAVHYAPDNLDCLVTCAYAHMKTGRHHEAELLYRKALSIDPSYARAGFGLATVLLLCGQLALGWRYYRARFDVQQIWLDGPWPIWDGEDLEGKTLLVRIEQGNGDTIQFVRFLPLLSRLHVGRILLPCSPNLRRLLSVFDHMVDFLPLELQVDAIQADYQTALMELPGLLGVNTVDQIPADCPYLFADAEDVLKWKDKVNAHAQGRFTIGLVWAGNPKQTDDHNRSMVLQELAPLLDLNDCCFFSLQLGSGSDQVGSFQGSVVNLTEDIQDFADTAAFMTALDFVVSVCTAPIHLAGALNRPGAVLLPFAADWRWLLNRNDSPWYPSLQLFRQQKPGDWQSVIVKLKNHIVGHRLQRK